MNIFLPNLAYDLHIGWIILTKNISMCKMLMCGDMKPVSLLFDQPTYYLCSENKAADQLRGYREADLRLCFRICKKPVFLRRGSHDIVFMLKTRTTEVFMLHLGLGCFIHDNIQLHS